jgi:DNA polymerase-3 subunit delta
MPPRFYLLYGLDEFGLAEFVEQLKQTLGDASLAALNTTLFDGRTVTLPDLRAACDAMPFLTERRLVLVEGWLTRLLSRGDDAEADTDTRGSASARETIQALLEYLPRQPDTTLLILVEKRDLPEKNPLLKTATGANWAQVKRFDLPKGEDLVKWIRARARAEGGDFSREAALALAQAESHPRALGHEIEKLLTYVDFKRPVERADVEHLTPAGSEARIFDLVDALGQRRGPPAQRQLHHLLETEEPLYLLGMIVRQFRLILLAREMLDARATEPDVAHALGLHSFSAGKICAQARNFSLTALERIYHRLLDCDADIKTGQAAAATVLDTLVAELTTP